MNAPFWISHVFRFHTWSAFPHCKSGLGINHCNYATYPPLLSGSLDPYLWWKPICSWFSILCCSTDFFGNCMQLCRSLVVLSHNHTITSVSRQCESVCRVGINDSNYATQPPLLAVYWMLICGGNQQDQLIFYAFVYNCVDHSLVVSHVHLCFWSVKNLCAAVASITVIMQPNTHY